MIHKFRQGVISSKNKYVDDLSREQLQYTYVICLQLADQSHRKRCQMTKRKNSYILTLLILTIQLSEQCSKSEKDIQRLEVLEHPRNFGIQIIEPKVK